MSVCVCVCMRVCDVCVYICSNTWLFFVLYTYVYWLVNLSFSPLCICLCCHGDAVNMIDFFHHQSKWKAEFKLFSDEPDNTFRLVVRWSHQLFSALSYLHRQGISHKRLYGELASVSHVISYVHAQSCAGWINQEVIRNDAALKEGRGNRVRISAQALVAVDKSSWAKCLSTYPPFESCIISFLSSM